MDDPDYPMGNTGDSSPFVSSTLGGNPSDSVLRSASRCDAISSSMSSRHTRTTSGCTVTPKLSTAEETPQQGAQGEVSLHSIDASLQSSEETAPPLTQSQLNRIRGEKIRAAYAKKKAEMLAEKEEVERAQRSSQNHVSPDVTYVAPLLAIPCLEAMEATPCILMVNNGPVIGNDIGYEVFMKMDGRPHNPTLSLSFACNKSAAMRYERLSEKAEEVESITFCFRPRQKLSKYLGLHMMEQYQYGMLHSVERANTTIWREEVVKSLNDGQIPHIGVFRFYCRYVESTALPTKEYWLRFPNIKRVFERIFGGSSVGFTIWVSLEHVTEASWAGFGIFDEAFRNRSS